MTSYSTDQTLTYDKAIAELRLIDDDFMRIVFKDRDCLELILSIILERCIHIRELHTQYDLKNILGRSIEIDAFATADGDYFNVDVQRENIGAHPKRARYHESLINAHISFPKERWNQIPCVYVIFITEHDVLGYGLPIYHISRRIDENNEKFNDESVIIYVNGSICDETPLGRLMHDFQCQNADDMYYEVLREKVKYYKEGGGRVQMCKIMEQIKNQGIEIGETRGIEIGETRGETRATLHNIKQIMLKMNFTVEEAMDLLSIPETKQQFYKEKIYS